MKPLLILLLLLLAIPQGMAEQRAFKKAVENNATTFNYRWLDHASKEQRLSFTIDNKTLFSRFRNFKGYQPQRVKRQILTQLRKHAAKFDPKKVTINFIEHFDNYEIHASGHDADEQQKALQALITARDQAQAKYLEKSYYNVLESKYGQSGVKPDHVRIANESLKDIAPLVKAMLAGKKNVRSRDFAQYVLGFVQSIPYSRLESRLESSGQGFNPPMKLLNNNQGDCDSKVTLMANIMRAAYPRMKVVIIYLPNHALIGMQLSHRKEDKYVRLEGRTFVLAEPTGPAMLPLATVAESSEHYIDGHQFSYEMF